MKLEANVMKKACESDQSKLLSKLNMYYREIDLRKVMEIITKNPELVDQKNKSGESAIFIVIRKNSLKDLQTLIKMGADVNIANDDIDSPLCIACLLSNLGIVEILINANANPNHEDSNLCTPVHRTLASLWFPDTSDPETFRKIMMLLVKNNANINAKSRLYGTVLHMLDYMPLGKEEKHIKEFLISLGANTKIKGGQWVSIGPSSKQWQNADGSYGKQIGFDRTKPEKI